MEDNKALEPSVENGFQEEASSFDFRTIFTLLILNWQWFLVSLIIFISGAYLYLRYQPAVYEVSAKMLIKDESNNRRGGSQMLANMQDLGFITNSTGIDNEIEILNSPEVVCRISHRRSYYQPSGLQEPAHQCGHVRGRFGISGFFWSVIQFQIG